MLITKQWIHAHHTPAGAWNRKQIEALGLSWPAKKGWIKELEGTEISAARQLLFEHHTKSSAKNPTYKELKEKVVAIEAKLLANINNYVK